MRVGRMRAGDFGMGIKHRGHPFSGSLRFYKRRLAVGIKQVVRPHHLCYIFGCARLIMIDIA